MNEEIREQMLNAASLLKTAASALEMQNTRIKQASDMTEDFISKGIIGADQREVYKEYLAEHPDKIASIKEAFKDMPGMASNALGEAVSNSATSNAYDAFDLAVLG